jgi:hypothetical protein
VVVLSVPLRAVVLSVLLLVLVDPVTSPLNVNHALVALVALVEHLVLPLAVEHLVLPLVAVHLDLPLAAVHSDLPLAAEHLDLLLVANNHFNPTN